MTLTAAGNHPDEHDPDRDRVCEWNGCLKLTTMTDDYCAWHVQEHEDNRDPAEPDDPDWQYEEYGW
mgnify:CR=1 FL=1